MREYRYRLTFRRRGAISFLSHLDMQRLFQKAAKRAGLNVSFSKGFNPHQLTSFALPLSTGMDADEEYFEIEFEEAQIEERLISSLNASLADGIEIYGAARMSETEKSAASAVYGAVYEITFPYDEDFRKKLDGIIEELLSEKEIIVRKTSKSGITDIDMRKRIHSVENISENDGIKLMVSLAAGSASCLKPDMLCEYVCQKAGVVFELHRTKYLRKKLLLESRRV